MIRDYTAPGQQSVEFSDLGDILATGTGRGMSTEVVAMVQSLIQRQIDAGHGREGFARIMREHQAGRLTGQEPVIRLV
ncbi:hypothetical protein [Pseudonocardia sp.]|uniref:imine reductase family protein n=1 Tax=Pseudonocardia sp. TaxID=60912 RepID=UPI0031FE17B6